MPVLDTGIYYRRPSNGLLDCRIKSGNDERLKRFALMEAAPSPETAPEWAPKANNQRKNGGAYTPVIKFARTLSSPWLFQRLQFGFRSAEVMRESDGHDVDVARRLAFQ